MEFVSKFAALLIGPKYSSLFIVIIIIIIVIIVSPFPLIKSNIIVLVSKRLIQLSTQKILYETRDFKTFKAYSPLN